MSELPRKGTPYAYALLLASSVFFASNALIGKAAAHAVPPVGLAFWRWAIALLIILPVALPGLVRHRGTLLADWKRLLLLGVLAMGICGAVFYMGLEHTSATNGALIYSIAPVLIVIISALWLREPVKPRQIAGIALALGGVLVILTRGDFGVLRHMAFNIGDLLVLSGAVSWALYTVLLRRAPMALPVITAFAANAIAGVIVLAPFYLLETLSGRPVVPTATTLASIAGVALFASVLAFLSYQKTIMLIGASRASAALYATPVWTALLASALLGEELQLFHVIGVLLVLPGVAMATLPPGKAAVQAAKA